MDEVLVCRPAAGLSYHNPVERVHTIANLALQSVGIMRQKMSTDVEGHIRTKSLEKQLNSMKNSNLLWKIV